MMLGQVPNYARKFRAARANRVGEPRQMVGGVLGVWSNEFELIIG
jgi:hypothetical protein